MGTARLVIGRRKHLPKKMRGFTLIEILVVLIIISIVTGFALMKLSRNDNHRLDTLSKEFIERLTLMEEQALLKSQVLALSFNNNGYQYMRYEAPVNHKKAHWQLIQSYLLPDDVAFAMDNEKESDEKVPAIIISSDGDLTPFTILVGRKGEAPRYLIKGESDGHIGKEYYQPE